MGLIKLPKEFTPGFSKIKQLRKSPSDIRLNSNINVYRAYTPSPGGRYYDHKTQEWISPSAASFGVGIGGEALLNPSDSTDNVTSDISGLNKSNGIYVISLSFDSVASDPYIFDSSGTRQLLLYNSSGNELRYFANGTERVTPSITLETGKIYNIVVKWPDSKIWINGQSFDGTDSNISSIGSDLYLFSRFTNVQSPLGARYLFAMVNGSVSDGLCRSLSLEPYQIFKPAIPITYFTAAAAGGAFTLTADSGTYTYTGTAADLTAAYALSADSGSYTYTGTAVDLPYGFRMAADSGAYSYTGTAAGLTADRVIGANSGSYTYSGTAVDLNRGYSLTADSGAYTYTGTVAALTFASPGNFTLTALTGEYTYTGTAADLPAGLIMAAASGSYTLTGTAADLTRGYTLSSDSGAYNYTGTAVQFTNIYSMSADSGSYGYTGSSAGLVSSAQVWTVQTNDSSIWTVQNNDSSTWTIEG